MGGGGRRKRGSVDALLSGGFVGSVVVVLVDPDRIKVAGLESLPCRLREDNADPILPCATRPPG